jgi:hypothetical protein
MRTRFEVFTVLLVNVLLVFGALPCLAGPEDGPSKVCYVAKASQNPAVPSTLCLRGAWIIQEESRQALQLVMDDGRQDLKIVSTESNDGHLVHFTASTVLVDRKEPDCGASEHVELQAQFEGVLPIKWVEPDAFRFYLVRTFTQNVCESEPVTQITRYQQQDDWF